MRSGLTALELPSLSRLKDREEESNIEVYWDTLKVGNGEGIKMQEFGPVKNNLNLKFGGNMGAII